ncbi:MAG: hypothetical protein AABW54_00470 [Candidatus Micrarchaeota archaeon]
MPAPTVTKKVVDSWKSKKWYTVVAPNFLNNIEVGEVPADSDESLVNRIISIPLKEITHDLSHMYTTVRLRITEINGRKALAKYIGHMVAREYLRTLVRRHRDVVDIVFLTRSSDGVEFRVKALAVTQNGCSETQKTTLRNALTASLRKKAESEEFSKFIQDVLFNKANAQIHERLEKIVPIRRVEIWKTELKEDFDTDKAGEQPEGEAGAVKEPSEEKAE